MSITFAQIFLAALAFYFVVQSFVCMLEIVHLKRTINDVPPMFAHKVTLAQHQKAAHYDIARTKLNWLEVTVTTALIIALTEGNVINMISDWLMQRVGDAFAFHWMLPASIGLIFVIVDLPFSWCKEFRLREAYGYCRTPSKNWLKEFFLDTIVGWLAVLPILWVGLFMWRHSDQAWWIIGWALFSIYLIFHLHLFKRLIYALFPKRATPINDEKLINALAHLGENTKINITGASICRATDSDELPPAFAYGHKNNVRLFFRHELLERISTDDLVAIAAHALARNKSHMYFKAWLVCSAVGFVVFAFLNWLAPQSWFLDEIGFRVYGPGPYYGSMMTFAIVALPVLLFPFKLPMDMFLRHLIFASDTFALKHTSLRTLTHALIELTPSPIRHSTVTLSIFDLLFSHEPSLMARIKAAEINADKWNAQLEATRIRNELSTVRQQQENVKVGLATGRAQAELKASEEKRIRQQAERRAYEETLTREALAARSTITTTENGIEVEKLDTSRLAMDRFIDPDFEKAQKALTQDNSAHATYNMTLWQGVHDLIRRYREWRALVNAQKEAVRLGQPMPTSLTSVTAENTETTIETSAQETPFETAPAVEPIIEPTSMESVPTEVQTTSNVKATPEEDAKDFSTETDNAVTVEPTLETPTTIVDKTVATNEVFSEQTGDETNVSLEEESTVEESIVLADMNTTTDEKAFTKKAKRRQAKALKSLSERQKQLYLKDQEHA